MYPTSPFFWIRKSNIYKLGIPHRVVSRVHFYSRLSTNRTWQCFILWHKRLYLHMMGHDNVSFCVLAFALASAFGYCSNLICGPFSNLQSNSFFPFFWEKFQIQCFRKTGFFKTFAFNGSDISSMILDLISL